jgi:hypothetical protein
MTGQATTLLRWKDAKSLFDGLVREVSARERKVPLKFVKNIFESEVLDAGLAWSRMIVLQRTRKLILQESRSPDDA